MDAVLSLLALLQGLRISQCPSIVCANNELELMLKPSNRVHNYSVLDFFKHIGRDFTDTIMRQ